RDPDILCLSSVDPAPKGPAAQRVAAVIYKASLTVKTASAESLHIHRHPVSRFHLFHSFSGFFHHPYKLMAQDSSRNSIWHRSMLDMDIAGTDSGKSHSHQDICIPFQTGPGPFCKD